MPPSYTEAFKVRYTDCDAYGHLNNAMYLRYIQEAAFNASGSLGLDPAAFEAMERTWFVRSTEIKYLQGIEYGDTVEVTTWLEGVRQATARRRYEIRKQGSEELSTQAYTDWVFMNIVDQNPVRIPDEIAQVYLPEGGSDFSPMPFPEPPPPPENVFTSRKRVEWRDIDPQLRLSNTAYLAIAEECAFQQAITYGWPLKLQEEEQIAFSARKSRIKYHQPALPQDGLEIRTWLYDLKSARGNRYYQFLRASDGELLAQLQTLWVFINTATGKPTRISQQFLEDYAENIVVREDPPT